jgi:hypothetical protein
MAVNRILHKRTPKLIRNAITIGKPVRYETACLYQAVRSPEPFSITKDAVMMGHHFSPPRGVS